MFTSKSLSFFGPAFVFCIVLFSGLSVGPPDPAFVCILYCIVSIFHYGLATSLANSPRTVCLINRSRQPQTHQNKHNSKKIVKSYSPLDQIVNVESFAQRVIYNCESNPEKKNRSNAWPKNLTLALGHFPWRLRPPRGAQPHSPPANHRARWPRSARAASGQPLRKRRGSF